MEPYRIISFDGGGVRGAFTTQVLLRLTRPPFNLDLSKVDLYAGTSTGSVIAGGLAMGLPIETVAKFYDQSTCATIFSKPAPAGSTGPKYDVGPLREFLGENYLCNPQLGELPHGLAVASFKLTSRYTHDWESVFFHNRQDLKKFPQKPESDYRNLNLLDAVLASSAAPIYFSPHVIKGRGAYIDGGVIANNPGIAAVSVATGRQNVKPVALPRVRLLSIGNGMVPHEIKDAKDWGALRWMDPKDPPLMDVLYDGSSDADDYYCQAMLGDRYKRLQVKLKKPILLDDHAEVPTLVEFAKSKKKEFVKELTDIAEWFNAA